MMDDSPTWRNIKYKSYVCSQRYANLKQLPSDNFQGTWKGLYKKKKFF